MIVILYRKLSSSDMRYPPWFWVEEPGAEPARLLCGFQAPCPGYFGGSNLIFLSGIT